MSSLFATIALLGIVAAGMSTLVGWARGAALAGPWVVVGILGAVVADMPWALWLQELSGPQGGQAQLGSGCLLLILVGHVALVGWLLARRFFPRFTDSRARSRERRVVDEDRRRR